MKTVRITDDREFDVNRYYDPDMKEWDEDKHPHDERGRWTSSSGAEDTELEKDLSPAAKTQLQNIENDIVRMGTERAAFVDPKTGDILHTQLGNQSQVQFSPDTIFKLRGKGAVLTHNHPNGTAMSPDDIAFAGNVHLSELRVITPNMLYRMKEDNSRWPTRDELAPAYQEVRQQVHEELDDQVFGGAMSVQDGNLNFAARVNRLLAQRLGLAFKEEPRHARN